MTKMVHGTWHVPFKGRRHAGAYCQNFLWQSGSVYVMDNHRAALWCWLQELDLNSAHSLFHIDQHTDCLGSRLDEWLENLPNWSAGISEYLDKDYEIDLGVTQRCKTIRWDNYLSIYFSQFGAYLEKCNFATHGDGDPPKHDSVTKIEIWDIPENMAYWLGQSDAPWIVNVDLDYFFWDAEEGTNVMVSDEFITEMFVPLRESIETGRVAVTTICLTPDIPFTPGWAATEALAGRILEILGIDFSLPNSPSNNAVESDT